MSKQARWSKLLELLAVEGKLDVEEAAAAVAVSAATIRRDLDELAEQRLLVRTRGGAIGHGVSYELPFGTSPPAEPPRSSGSPTRWRTC